jgi:hypothetical protein
MGGRQRHTLPGTGVQYINSAPAAFALAMHWEYWDVRNMAAHLWPALLAALLKGTASAAVSAGRDAAFSR